MLRFQSSQNAWQKKPINPIKRGKLKKMNGLRYQLWFLSYILLSLHLPDQSYKSLHDTHTNSIQYDCTENSLASYLEKKMAFTRWEYKTNIKMGDYCIETNSDHTIKTLDPFSAFISLPSNIKHTRKKKTRVTALLREMKTAHVRNFRASISQKQKEIKHYENLYR